MYVSIKNFHLTTAELFSIIQTAQVNLLIPDRYLTWVMYNIDKCVVEDLLPWSEKNPDELHVHKKDLEKKAN